MSGLFLYHCASTSTKKHMFPITQPSLCYTNNNNLSCLKTVLSLQRCGQHIIIISVIISIITTYVSVEDCIDAITIGSLFLSDYTVSIYTLWMVYMFNTVLYKQIPCRHAIIWCLCGWSWLTIRYWSTFWKFFSFWWPFRIEYFTLSASLKKNIWNISRKPESLTDINSDTQAK